jgi:putative ABC transport system permease protein
VRKVLGASVASITRLLTSGFLKLVAVSIIIAMPVSYIAIHKWLESFAYRVDISLWVFLAVGLTAIIIAFATVSIESITAATANPIKSLRIE